MLHLNTIDKNTFHTLQSLFSKDYLKGFALAGGTSLALQIGHRKSLDIDLFAYDKVEMKEVAIELQNDFEDTNIQKISTSFIFGFINGVKSDFINHSRLTLIKECLEEDGIRFFSLEDIAAVKCAAVCGRGTKKDFYDIYSLLKKFTLRQLLEWHDKKFNTDNSWMVLKSLQYFAEADLSMNPELIIEYPDWEDIKRFFFQTVNQYKL